MSQRAGVVTGFVQAVDAAQGRVQVEYRGMQDDLLSPWAYIAAPMSGQGRGALFMPEAGDEVLVCFADGDFNHPFVVGFLWNGEHTSPEEHAYNRVIVTPGGHQLRFEDNEGDKRVVLRSEAGRSLTLEDRVPGKVVVNSLNHEIVLDDLPAGSKISINAGKSVTALIELTQTPEPALKISVAGNTIDVSGTGVSINTPGNVSLTSAGNVSVTSAGAASVVATSAAITAGSLTVNAGMTTFSGAVVCASLSAGAISSPLYSPGIGNWV